MALSKHDPLTRDDLIGWLESGCRPREQWRIGAEHEKFVFRTDDFRPPAYEGERGIGALLRQIMERDPSWTGVYEGDALIALSGGPKGSITLEPGGQLELSGAVLGSVHETCKETTDHHKAMKAVAQDLDLAFLGLGFNPKWHREDFHWMPKGRYRIMRSYMPKVGSLGLDMMLRTCTVQANLDFSSEADMVKKFRVSLALQPVATALFASSPFREGKPSGYLSTRAHIWTDTDRARTGLLPFVFEDGMGFERYADYLLDVPMYFVHRGDTYIDASGQSFRDFMNGRLEALPGELPVLSDWEDHSSVAFPEVRLKRYLEMRGADAGRWQDLCALPALWIGLLYDTTALDAAWDLVRDWTLEERAALYAAVPTTGLRTPFRDGTVRDLALKVLEIAAAGLKARAITNERGQDESMFLDALWMHAEEGKSQADRLLEFYHQRWNDSVDPIFAECMY
ncbi:glutamate--cysteine ligase [Phaeovibrio sulfidiphilus]|uniref:Glutamate--cysteine ligase n=1 Tax=Phaeovibrio sulfidiphilus TaxID=1220600 RepID=A0A8J6YNG5_9PROT|nr:glutamate--cysteine ligase [Phaeovibrio sulfidiphilus]MBE1236566.1 glutamate--cysteine ligase [Phaeovibrio sulfidiphilus]